MRKIPFIIIFFLSILFQSTATRLLPQIETYFFLPNLCLVLLAYIALYAGPELGIIIGFFLGFFEDSLSSELMGLNSLVKTLLGFVLGMTALKFFVANRILQFLSVVVLTITNDVTREVIKILLNAGSAYDLIDLPGFFLRKTLPESILNGLVGILLFTLFDRWQLVKRGAGAE
jgi:rod shape-determining protein MreD